MKTIEDILDGEPPPEDEVEAMLADLRQELGHEPTATELEKVAVRLNETTSRVQALLFAGWRPPGDTLTGRGRILTIEKAIEELRYAPEDMAKNTIEQAHAVAAILRQE